MLSLLLGPGTKLYFYSLRLSITTFALLLIPSLFMIAYNVIGKSFVMVWTTEFFFYLSLGHSQYNITWPGTDSTYNWTYGQYVNLTSAKCLFLL
jgi:hypothetical protein